MAKKKDLSIKLIRLAAALEGVRADMRMLRSEVAKDRVYTTNQLSSIVLASTPPIDKAAFQDGVTAAKVAFDMGVADARVEDYQPVSKPRVEGADAVPEAPTVVDLPNVPLWGPKIETPDGWSGDAPVEYWPMSSASAVSAPVVAGKWDSFDRFPDYQPKRLDRTTQYGAGRTIFTVHGNMK